jgi:hypothetical protein
MKIRIQNRAAAVLLAIGSLALLLVGARADNSNNAADISTSNRSSSALGH